MMKTPKPAASQSDGSPGRKPFIVRTAARLFGAQGFKATSMDTLAQACGINKATLYYYYPSKADILLDISLAVRRDLDPLSKEAETQSAALDGLILFATGILEVANRDRDAFTVYFRESSHFDQHLSEEQFAVFRESERSMMKIVYGILNRGRYTGEFVECDVRYVGRLYIFMVMSAARWPEPQIDVARVVATIRTVFLSGLLSSKPA